MTELTKMDFFHTPTNWDELLNWIDRHSREDRPRLLTALAMAWNLAISLDQVNITDKEACK